MAIAVLLIAPTGRVHALPLPDQMVELGAHTLLTQADGLGTPIAISAALATQPSGSALIALVGGYANNADAPTDSYANAWKPLGQAVAYNGFEGRFKARAYLVLDAGGGSGHTFSFIKTGTPSGEITAAIVEVRHAGKLQAVAQNYPSPRLVTRPTSKLARFWQEFGLAGPLSSVTSDNVTTTGPATLVAVWWGDSRALNMTAVPGDGFKVIDRYLNLPPESGVQCAVAIRQVETAGTYDVTWTGAPAQGAILWLFAFQSGPQQVVPVKDSKSPGS